ncbi:MAG TPA: hypothetical protein PLL69_04530 [Gemmatimonadales bacterium]|nr:hypothetical protein [Gemmatimonadales bacterium]
MAFGSDRGGSFDIWVIDVASGTLRQLVDWPGYEYVGAWNADGSAIYFVSDRDSRLADLWLAPLSGAEPARITRDGSVGSVSESRDRQEVFVDIIGEESGRLAHARVLPGGELSTVWDASNSVVALPSPSGESVAILGERTDGAGMHVILVGTPGIGGAGGPPRPILEQPVAFPQAWSPDGTRLLYQTVNSAQGDLWVYTLATGESQLLRATPESEDDAEWLSDGQTIVFTRSQNEERIITSDLTGLLGGRPR